ncbi:MAG: hypothetical protein KatS3mg022_1672 [Armatimonadota bacterium]|nr:MAG: hypothetical protein KatS3mg022_1672 [Armatimonadota bacterium]
MNELLEELRIETQMVSDTLAGLGEVLSEGNLSAWEELLRKVSTYLGVPHDAITPSADKEASP